jgi:hypothetical protein
LGNKVYIFEEINPEVKVVRLEQKPSVNIYEPNKVITIFEKGPKGDKGDVGPSGQQQNPFYLISEGNFETTASIAFNYYISSSLIPEQSINFNLGSLERPWQTLYLSSSIYIGDTEIVKQRTNNQQIFKIQSGSVSASFDSNGIFTISELNSLPPNTTGGIIKFQDSFYIGT